MWCNELADVTDADGKCRVDRYSIVIKSGPFSELAFTGGAAVVQ